MAIKTYKPVTNGRRNMTSLTFEEITTKNVWDVCMMMVF